MLLRFFGERSLLSRLHVWCTFGVEPTTMAAGVAAVGSVLGSLAGRSKSTKQDPGTYGTKAGISGGVESSSQSSTQSKSGTVTETSSVADEAIYKIISDVIGGTKGLSALTTGQNASGLYGSTVATFGANDLMANLAGEIAKYNVTKEVATEEGVLANVLGSTTQDDYTASVSTPDPNAALLHAMLTQKADPVLSDEFTRLNDITEARKEEEERQRFDDMFRSGSRLSNDELRQQLSPRK